MEDKVMAAEEKKDPKAPISFEDLGGRKVGHSVPVKAGKAIDFSSIGGKCVRKASDHPAFKKEDDAHE